MSRITRRRRSTSAPSAGYQVDLVGACWPPEWYMVRLHPAIPEEALAARTACRSAAFNASVGGPAPGAAPRCRSRSSDARATPKARHAGAVPNRWRTSRPLSSPFDERLSPKTFFWMMTAVRRSRHAQPGVAGLSVLASAMPDRTPASELGRSNVPGWAATDPVALLLPPVYPHPETQSPYGLLPGSSSFSCFEHQHRLSPFPPCCS